MIRLNLFIMSFQLVFTSFIDNRKKKIKRTMDNWKSSVPGNSEDFP